MKYLFHRYLKLTILVTLLVSSVSALDISSMDEAVNIAGRQRMLSYRILKSYLMIAIESNYKNPKKKLQADLKLFEESQLALKKYIDTKGLKTSIDKTDVAFAKEKDILSKPFDKSKVDQYLFLAKSTKDAANTVVEELVKQSGHSGSKLIGIIGSLRLYSQQMTAYYMLKTMGSSSKKLQDSMSSTMKSSKNSLSYISATDIKNQKALKALKKIEKIGRFFNIMEASDTFVPTMVVKKGNKVVKYANEMIEALKEKK